MVWLPDGEKNEDIFIRFDAMHERDRHTPQDGIGLCIASRGKNLPKSKSTKSTDTSDP